MTKSRSEELNPPHNCSECGVEHFYIPPIKVGDVNYAPIEIMVVADGTAPFRCDDEPRHEDFVPVVGMLWGVPGNPNPFATSVIVLN